MTHATTNPFDDDHSHEECTIFGIYGTSEAEITPDIGADSLSFTSINSMYLARGKTAWNGDDPQLCAACFTSEYPIKLASGLSGKRVSHGNSR